MSNKWCNSANGNSRIYVIFIVEFPSLYAYGTIWLNIVGAYESLDDKFHAPMVASSSEFHGSSKLPFRSKSLCLLYLIKN